MSDTPHLYTIMSLEFVVEKVFKEKTDLTKSEVLVQTVSLPGDSQRGLNPGWPLAFDPDELPLPGRDCNFSTRSHNGRGSTPLQNKI